MKRTILILLAFNVGFNVSSANSEDGETRTANVTMEVSSTDIVNIQAKYTDLIVEAWDQDEVFIEATVRFDGRMTDKVQKFLDSFEDDVKSNITKSIGELRIETNLNEPNKFQLGSKYLGIQIGFSEDELKVEYSVKMPASNSVTIKNSYQDVIMRGRFQDVIIDQYSGDLDVEYIETAEFKLKYGSAQIDQIEDAKMELYEQDIDANLINKLTIDTKYSDLKVKDLGSTEIISYESDFEVGSLELLNGKLKYGKLEITRSLKDAELTTYEFDIDAASIESLVLVNSKYGNLEAESIDNLRLQQSYEDDFDIDNLGKLIADEAKYGDFVIGELKDELELSGYECEIKIKRIDSSTTNIDISGKYIETSIDTEGIDYTLKANTKYGKIDIDKTNMSIKKYIKDGDLLEIEANSPNSSSENPVLISISGYEMDLEFD